MKRLGEDNPFTYHPAVNGKPGLQATNRLDGALLVISSQVPGGLRYKPMMSAAFSSNL
jgi:hypothetical protein